jgi:tight adherence protein C
MCVAAGIGFHSGMQRVAASQDNPLSQEFSRVLAEMKLGQSRSAALSALSERLQIESLEQFVNSILQVDRLGVPMTRVLEEQSKRLRNQRREKAREQAQKLPVKILAPTMIFMLPSLLIIVLGPAVISILRSFG